MSAQERASQVWRPEHLRLAIDAACVALWSWQVDSDRFTMDERAFDLWGLPWAEEVAFEELSTHIHPADRDRVRAAFAATRSVAGPYESDFRIMLGDDVRWISARGQGADEGIVGRVMFGIFLDVTGRKQAEEGHELLAGEMSHRVKNLLAIATGLTHISSRSVATSAEMATNSLKHGALSVQAGVLDVSSTSDESDLFVVWAESGGPTVTGAPVMSGFGSKMIARSLAHDLNGELAYDWQENGLVVTLRMRRDRLAA